MNLNRREKLVVPVEQYEEKITEELIKGFMELGYEVDDPKVSVTQVTWDPESRTVIFYLVSNLFDDKSKQAVEAQDG